MLQSSVIKMKADLRSIFPFSLNEKFKNLNFPFLTLELNFDG